MARSGKRRTFLFSALAVGLLVLLTFALNRLRETPSLFGRPMAVAMMMLLVAFVAFYSLYRSGREKHGGTTNQDEDRR